MTDWMELAECRKHDANLFNSMAGRGTALHICRVHCPVKSLCRQWANETGGWARQTIGGQWWTTKRGHGTGPVQGDLPVEATYCKTCRPDCQSFEIAVEPEGPMCPECKRGVELDNGGGLAWHTASGIRGDEVCVGSGRKP